MPRSAELSQGHVTAPTILCRHARTCRTADVGGAGSTPPSSCDTISRDRSIVRSSLVPRPSQSPVFDRFCKTGGGDSLGTKLRTSSRGTIARHRHTIYAIHTPFFFACARPAFSDRCVEQRMREYYAAMSGLGKVKELAGRPGVNPQDLDDTGGEEEETELSYALKELFWDKIVVFLTTAIIGLSAVDILTELLRGGSGIVCFVPDELNLTEGQEDYVDSYCAQSVPDTQYLPIFVLVQGVLVASWHYLWKSSFTSHFDYFFSLAKTLTRLSDETTGEYPRKNLNIIKKLEIEFSTFSPSKILRWYQAKLGAQLITAVVSMLFLFLVFTNFDVNFNCPRIENQYWPIPGEKINCIFTSLRLFSLVRVADAFLLVLVILAVLWGFIWSISRHTTELGCTNVALFSYTTGISPEYFLPKPMFSHIRGFFANICSARIGQEIVLRFFSPRIKTDLDFLLMMLYRTDSGLGHSFKEGQIYTSYKRLSDADLLRLNIHIRTKRNNSTEGDITITSILIYSD